MSFTTHDDTQVQLSNCEVVGRPVGAQYYEREGVPYVRIATRIQDVRETQEDSICCLYQEFEDRDKENNTVETNETVSSIVEILRARRQVFNWYMRPRGTQGEELTFENWENMRKKAVRLVSALGIGHLMVGKPVSLPTSAQYDAMTKKQQVAALKKIVAATKADMQEMAEVIQARVDELRGTTGTRFCFKAITSFFGTNYTVRETRDGEHTYLQRYLNLRFIA